MAVGMELDSLIPAAKAASNGQSPVMDKSVGVGSPQ